MLPYRYRLQLDNTTTPLISMAAVELLTLLLDDQTLTKLCEKLERVHLGHLNSQEFLSSEGVPEKLAMQAKETCYNK